MGPGFGSVEDSPAAPMVKTVGQQIPLEAWIIDGVDPLAVA